MTQSNPDPDLLRAAADPSTSRAKLADLAYEHEELRPAIAANPSTYEGLLEWLRELDDPAILEALAIRERGTSEGHQDNILRVSEAPSELPVSESGAVALVIPDSAQRSPQSSPTVAVAPKTGWRTIITKPFVIIFSCAIVIAIIIAIVVSVSATPDSQNALSTQPTTAHHHHKASGPAVTPTPAPTPTSSPTPAAPAGFVTAGFSYGWQQGFTAPGGYTEQVTVSVGAPEPVGTAYPTQVSSGTCDTYDPTDSSKCQIYGTEVFKGGKYCDANSATDAVIPMLIDSTSTTARFKQTVGSSFTFNYDNYNTSSDDYFGMARTLEYEGVYSSTGPQCESSASGGYYSTDTLADGGDVALQMFLIVPDYFTPDHPGGDASVLQEISLGLTGSSNGETSWQPDGSPIEYENSASSLTTLASGTAMTLGGS